MACIRIGTVYVIAALAGISTPARALPVTYQIVPGSTDIDFAVDILGLVTAHGEFTRFSGKLTVDFDAPQDSTVAVDIDTQSASMTWAPAAKLVKGEHYLDVAHYPDLQFVSDHVNVIDKGRVQLDGKLTLHGVSHGEIFEADLVNRHWNDARTAEEADFSATGSVRRSDYHMAAGPGMVDDRVTITIRSKLVLTAGTAAASNGP